MNVIKSKNILYQFLLFVIIKFYKYYLLLCIKSIDCYYK